MPNTVRYPLGIQTFEKIIEGGYLYVDKSEYVYNMTHSDSSYLFLSRPRRFGKSLLTSTLKAYFEGRKELFQGLAIEKLETTWDHYPVLHFSLATAKHGTKERLESELNLKLFQYEEIYGTGVGEELPNQRFQGVIKRAYKQTGKQVVILIDEYDAPLLDVMHEDENLKALRKVMQDFYSPLKDCDPYIRFVFITGITKFSQLSIFSELNNLKNISMLKEYAGVCGITEQEILEQMGAGIDALAAESGWTKEQAIAELKGNYDGYHFSWPSPDVYNPFSLLNALSDKKIDAYWFESGTPTYLIEMMRKFHVMPSQLGSPLKAQASDFDAPTERMKDLIPLLYQSGYVTIKDCSPLGLYTLNIPNREIRIGLMKSLIPNYLGAESNACGVISIQMQEAMLNDDIDSMMHLLQDFLGTTPQTENTHYEGHWQQMLYVIFSLLGAHVDVEVRTKDGRIDMVARTAQKLYLFELKLNKSAEAAMNQIDLKNYPARYALCGLPIVKIGINFSVEERNITDWTIVM